MCGGGGSAPAPVVSPTPVYKNTKKNAPDPDAMSEAREYAEQNDARTNRKTLAISLGSQQTGGSGLAV